MTLLFMERRRTTLWPGRREPRRSSRLPFLHPQTRVRASERASDRGGVSQAALKGYRTLLRGTPLLQSRQRGTTGPVFVYHVVPRRNATGRK